MLQCMTMRDFVAESLLEPQNSGILRAIRTAKSWNKEPLDIIVGTYEMTEPYMREYLNTLLMMAYQIIEDETCNSCGVPYWLGKSTINTVAFDLKETNCYSCAELEQDREAESKKNSKKTFGVTKYIVPVAEEGFTLPTREESYRKMSS